MRARISIIGTDILCQCGDVGQTVDIRIQLTGDTLTMFFHGKSVERVRARNSECAQKGVGNIVLARERPGVRDGKFACRVRSSELVRENGLAPLRCGDCETP